MNTLGPSVEEGTFELGLRAQVESGEASGLGRVLVPEAGGGVSTGMVVGTERVCLRNRTRSAA